MQGIILLGGNGSRLNMFSRRVSNKALALVYDRLVFEYPLNTLVKAGITEITCILGGRYSGHLVSVLGDGKEYGITNITYVYQKDPKGISDAIYKAKNSIHDKCAVILGDNFFEDDISHYVKDFENNKSGCAIFTKEVSDPERYGVVSLKKNKVVHIEEKPKNPKSNMAVTGLYFYDKTLFEKIETLKPSIRGELEVTDLNMLYINEGSCQAYPINGFWNDMGTFDSILDTSAFVRNKKYKLNYSINAWNIS